MSDKEVIETAKKLVQREAETLLSLAESLDESFVDVVKLVYRCKGKVFVLGSGTSGTISKRMAHLLSVCGTPAVALNPMDCLHGTMGAITSHDIVFLISKGGETDELVKLADILGAQGVYRVVITESLNSSLTSKSDFIVKVHTKEGADVGGVIAMGSTLVVGAWGDALAAVLMRARGRTWEQVLQIHPGGAVGKKTNLPDALDTLSI